MNIDVFFLLQDGLVSSLFPLDDCHEAVNVGESIEGEVGDVMYTEDINGRESGAMFFKGSDTSGAVIPNTGNLDMVFDFTISMNIYFSRVQESQIIYYGGEHLGLKIRILQNGKIVVTLPPREDVNVQQQHRHHIPFFVEQDIWYFMAFTYKFDTGILTAYIKQGEMISVETIDIGSFTQATAGDVIVGGFRRNPFQGAMSCLQIFDIAYEQNYIMETITLCDVGKN